ncbi:putative defense protein 3 [Armadillidium vulgare]|nr:putative defense protein 3 [Armadillidium vulgare]
MAMKFLMFGVMLVGLRSSFAYNSGAPEQTCDSMTPGHTPFQPQVTTSPFTLNAFKTGVPGEVTIELRSRDNQPFKGFMLKAFRPGLNGDVRHLGEFVNFHDFANKVECPLEQVLTHWNSQPKTELKFTWNAKENGNIQFRATVVQAYDIFYMNILSPVINL